MSIVAHRDVLEKLQRVGYRKRDYVADVSTGERDRERFRLEPATTAGCAGSSLHVLLQLQSDGVGFGLVVTALDIGDDSFPVRSGCVGSRSTLAARAVEKLLFHVGTELAPGRVEVEPELFGESGENHFLQIPIRLSPRENHALEDADAQIAEYQLFADFATRAKTAARRTSTKRRVEREMTRFQLRKRDAALRTAVFLREEVRAPIVGPLHLDQSFGEFERGFDRIIQTPAIFGADHEAVDDDRDVVVHPTIQLRRVGDLDEISIDDRADEALLAGGVEQLAEFSFATAYERREDLDPGAFRPLKNGIGNLAGALSLDRATAIRAVRRPGAGVEKTEVVVDLGDGPDRRARVVAGALLLDRNCR